ncbi:glycerophosphodiester phosphodiesterase family protein [Lentilactobacillus senioris]|uniref:glycerophosphodiester phosphodiesterase family protein n=1 Tax=Lentilactobacillus senioris TaxID=931534 RepID=UPI003D2C45AB
MQTKVSLNGTELMLIVLISVVGQWSTGQDTTWSFLVPVCFLIIIMGLVFIGRQILSNQGKSKSIIIGLGILGLAPLNFMGLLAEVMTYIPVSRAFILFLNNHFKLVITSGIGFTIMVWALLAVMLARFWHTSVKIQLVQILKNLGWYVCWLAGLTLILILVANIFKIQWMLVILNAGLILGLSIGQLRFLVHVWAGNLPVQIKNQLGINIIICILVIALGVSITNVMYTTAPQQIIAHRGVYRNDQIPNSIAALTQTSHQKFNFVEMDVRETKDHYFVCQHDDELDWGKNQRKRIEDLTLKQIKKHDRVELFDDYIARANQKQQRLLVEIKPGGNNAKSAGTDFVSQFKSSMEQNHGLVHSMELDYLQQIKRETNKIPVGIVVTINTGDLMTKAVDFYSVQAFTLNPAFLQQANQLKRPVYVWTVRRPLQAQILATLPITGQITDIGSVVRHIEKSAPSNKSMFLVATSWNYL